MPLTLSRLDARLVALLARAAGGAGVIINAHTLRREQTIRVVDVLSRWFEFVSLDEMQTRPAAPRRRPFCVLTFDDGKKSNATVTAPILRSLGVPAVFYVVTESLSRGEPLWVDRYYALLDHVGTPPPGLERESVKRLPHRERMQRLRREMERHQVVVPLSADVQPMTWDDARELASHGFVIGSHGATHAILTREPRDEAFGEIEESLASVSRELGSPCRTFAFPNGNHDDGLCRHALACGATTVMTTDPMWVGHRTPFWRLPRVQIYESSSRMHVRLKTTLAAVPGTLANPDGTGRAYLVS